MQVGLEAQVEHNVRIHISSQLVLCDIESECKAFSMHR